MATDDQSARPRDAEIALAQVRSLPKPALARPPPTRQTARKGCLNFLYFERLEVVEIEIRGSKAVLGFQQSRDVSSDGNVSWQQRKGVRIAGGLDA